MREYNCDNCLKPCETHLAQLCDACFAMRKQQLRSVRQSGRTLPLIQQLDREPDAVLVVHESHYAAILQRAYPHLRQRIWSQEQASRDFYRSGGKWLVDHTVFELPHAEFMERYRDWLHSQPIAVTQR